MKTKVVKVWAPWCAACANYRINFEEAQNQLGLMYPDIEWLEWNADTMDTSVYNVSVLPTTLIFQDEGVVATKVGRLETPELIEFVVQTINEGAVNAE